MADEGRPIGEGRTGGWLEDVLVGRDDDFGFATAFFFTAVGRFLDFFADGDALTLEGLALAEAFFCAAVRLVPTFRAEVDLPLATAFFTAFFAVFFALLFAVTFFFAAALVRVAAFFRVVFALVLTLRFTLLDFFPFDFAACFFRTVDFFFVAIAVLHLDRTSALKAQSYTTSTLFCQ